MNILSITAIRDTSATIDTGSAVDPQAKEQRITEVVVSDGFHLHSERSEKKDIGQSSGAERDEPHKGSGGHPPQERYSYFRLLPLLSTEERRGSSFAQRYSRTNPAPSIPTTWLTAD